MSLFMNYMTDYDKFIMDIPNIEKFIKSKYKKKIIIETVHRQTKRRYI